MTSDQIKSLMKKAGLHSYQSTPEEDICLVKWWIQLRANSEYNILFDNIGILSFFKRICPPTIFLYSVDDVDILTFACWFEPMSLGAQMSYWVSKDARASKISVMRLAHSYQIGLSEWPVLLTASSNQRHLTRLVEFGHVELGIIPGFTKDDKTLTYITRSGFRRGTLGEGGHKDG